MCEHPAMLQNILHTHVYTFQQTSPVCIRQALQFTKMLKIISTGLKASIQNTAFKLSELEEKNRDVK